MSHNDLRDLKGKRLCCLIIEEMASQNILSTESLLGISVLERFIHACREAGIKDFYLVKSKDVGESLPRSTTTRLEKYSISFLEKIEDNLLEQWDFFLVSNGVLLVEPDIIKELIFDALRKGNSSCIRGGNKNSTYPIVVVPATFLKYLKGIKELTFTTIIDSLLTTAVNIEKIDPKDRVLINITSKNDLKKAEEALIAQLKGKINDGIISKHFNRPISTRITRLIVNFPITPNEITLVSFFLSIIASFLFAVSSYFALLAGGIIAQFASIIDGCDGEVARIKYLASDYGKWLDAVLDRYADAFLLFGLMLYDYTRSHSIFTLFIGFFAIIGSFMVSYTADKYDNLMARELSHKKRHVRIGRDLRVFIIFIGAITNQPFLALLVLAFIMNIEALRRILICRVDYPLKISTRY